MSLSIASPTTPNSKETPKKKKRKKIEEGGKKNRFHFRWEDCEPPVMSYIATKVIILSELAGELKTALERQ